MVRTGTPVSVDSWPMVSRRGGAPGGVPVGAGPRSAARSFMVSTLRLPVAGGSSGLSGRSRTPPIRGRSRAGSGPQDDLAAQVAALAFAVRGRGLGERELLPDEDLELSGAVEVEQVDEPVGGTPGAERLH